MIENPDACKRFHKLAQRDGKLVNKKRTVKQIITGMDSRIFMPMDFCGC
jgi:hypothetical protein